MRKIKDNTDLLNLLVITQGKLAQAELAYELDYSWETSESLDAVRERVEYLVSFIRSVFARAVIGH